MWVGDGEADLADGRFQVLLHFASRFKFLMVTERWIEARHAITNELLTQARNGGAAYLHFAQVSTILAEMLRDPKVFERFIGHMSKANNPRMCSSTYPRSSPFCVGCLHYLGHK